MFNKIFVSRNAGNVIPHLYFNIITVILDIQEHCHIIRTRMNIAFEYCVCVYARAYLKYLYLHFCFLARPNSHTQPRESNFSIDIVIPRGTSMTRILIPMGYMYNDKSWLTLDTTTCVD